MSAHPCDLRSSMEVRLDSSSLSVCFLVDCLVQLLGRPSGDVYFVYIV